MESLLKDSAWFFMYSLFLIGSSFISSKIITGVAFLLNSLAWVLFLTSVIVLSESSVSLFLVLLLCLWGVACSLGSIAGTFSSGCSIAFIFLFLLTIVIDLSSVVEIDLNTINKDYRFRFKYLELSINTEERGIFFSKWLLKKLSSSLGEGEGIISRSNMWQPQWSQHFRFRSCQRYSSKEGQDWTWPNLPYGLVFEERWQHHCDCRRKALCVWDLNADGFKKKKGIYGNKGKPTSHSCVCWDDAGNAYSGGANSCIYVWVGQNLTKTYDVHGTRFVGAIKWCDGKIVSGAKDGKVVISNPKDGTA